MSIKELPDWMQNYIVENNIEVKTIDDKLNVNCVNCTNCNQCIECESCKNSSNSRKCKNCDGITDGDGWKNCTSYYKGAKHENSR